MTDELENMTPNQRRALNKALSALEAMAGLWAAEIRLTEMEQRIADVTDAAERANRIAAMIEQGFIEGAYRHYLDHKDQIAALESAAKATVPEGYALVPKAMTERMKDEADFAMQNHAGEDYGDSGDFDGWYQPVWTAIVAAAPAAPAAIDNGGGRDAALREASALCQAIANGYVSDVNPKRSREAADAAIFCAREIAALSQKAGERG